MFINILNYYTIENKNYINIIKSLPHMHFWQFSRIIQLRSLKNIVFPFSFKLSCCFLLNFYIFIYRFFILNKLAFPIFLAFFELSLVSIFLTFVKSILIIEKTINKYSNIFNFILLDLKSAGSMRDIILKITIILVLFCLEFSFLQATKFPSSLALFASICSRKCPFSMGFSIFKVTLVIPVLSH